MSGRTTAQIVGNLRLMQMVGSTNSTLILEAADRLVELEAEVAKLRDAVIDRAIDDYLADKRATA